MCRAQYRNAEDFFPLFISTSLKIKQCRKVRDQLLRQCFALPSFVRARRHTCRSRQPLVTRCAQSTSICSGVSAVCPPPPPPFPPSTLSNVLIFFSDVRKTDKQAKEAVWNLTKKPFQSVRAQVPFLSFFLFCAGLPANAQACAKRARANWTPAQRKRKSQYTASYKQVRNCFAALIVVRWLLFFNTVAGQACRLIPADPK
jgi:hypothetical protein